MKQTLPTRASRPETPTVRVSNWFVPLRPGALGRKPGRPAPETVAAEADRGYELPDGTAPAWSATASVRRTWISRTVLGMLLLVQALLTVRLHNTAFEDEALYLFAGHLELDHLLHGAPVPGGFDSYFSGAPVLYPVLAAAIDGPLGLVGARALSLLAMLTTTALLYSITRRLFNERTGLCAAGMFAVCQSTLVVGNLATFDAVALCLLAVTAWIAVYTAQRHLLLGAVAAPVAVLAVAVKYAAALYLPTIVVLTVLVAYQRWGAVRALLRGGLFTAATAGLLAAGLDLSGYLTAIRGTTTQRAHGTDGALTMLADSVNWAGVLFAVAVLGTILYVRRGRLNELSSLRYPLPGARWRAALGIVLTGTALLAPAYQIHLSTEVSLHKHIGYGLLFAAPMAGVGLTRIMGAHFRYPQLAIAVGVTMLAMGIAQSNALFHAWPDSGQLVALLRPQLKPDGRYLADTYEVPVYYLRDRTSYQQWTSTYRLAERQSDILSTVDSGGYDFILLDSVQPGGAADVVRDEVRRRGNYRLLAALSGSVANGTAGYQVWVRNTG